MTNNLTQDWNNYWQGRSAKESGDALIGVGIEHNNVLEQHWLNFFGECQKDMKLIDLACGAGSALKHAHKIGFENITGVDVSQDAINIMTSKFPKAQGIVSSVDELPLETGEFDIIVSQFGFEYAGSFDRIIASVKEMTRISSGIGKISLVSHIKGGAIERGCLQSLSHINVIRNSGFLDVVERVFQDLFRLLESKPRPPAEHFYKTLMPINPAAEPIMSLLRASKNQNNDFIRFIYHIMESSHKLIGNFERYELNDCLDWVQNARREIEAYQGRMESMTSAALDEHQAAEIKKVIKKNGFFINTFEKLYLNKSDAPAAWAFIATR